MSNEMYLIHGEDYIAHINDKIRLFSMLKQMTHMVGKLPVNEHTKDVIVLAKRFGTKNEEMFRTWGIPGTYLVYGNEADLEDLMENELIAPEDAGYFCCDECCEADEDDECCDDDCEGICESCMACCADDEDEEDVDEFAETMATLASVLHSIFGDGASIHISVE